MAQGASLSDSFVAVQRLNSDNDPSGASNLEEIQASTQPGWTGSSVYGVVGDLDPVTSAPDADPPAEIALPNINVSPTSLDFGTVDVGSTETQKTTISNVGSAELEVTGLSLTRATSGDFELNTVPTTPFTIPAYGSVKVLVDYTPSGAGGASGALEIASYSPGEEQITVSLSGSGFVPAADECAISVNPSALEFDSVEVDTPKTLSARLTNASSVDCEVDAVVSPADGAFTLVSGDSLTVEPGDSANVTVEYLPAYLGDDAGKLELATNDPDHPVIAVPLSGTGVEAGDVALELDLDIAKLAVRKRSWLSSGKPVVIMLMVKNGGLVEGEALATLIGVQDGVEVYNESRKVTDGTGRGRTKNLFPAYLPEGAGEIQWTATIEDGDPDDDVATAATRIMNR